MDDLDIKNFKNYVLRNYEVEFYIYKTRLGDLKLDEIKVPKPLQGEGIGTSIMQELIRFADKQGYRIVLTPDEKNTHTGTTSSARLKRFYKRFGFVENKGRNKDYRTSDTMIRHPETSKSFSDIREEFLTENKLKNFISVKMNDRNADFWILARGSEKTVGKPVKEYDKYAFGITVTATDQLVPDYLFYVMLNLHMQGHWKSVATSTTGLVNIRKSDIENIQIG